MTTPPNIRVNLNVPFPAQQVGSAPVTVTKQNGIYTIGLSVSSLGVQNPAQASLSTDYALCWDNVAKVFFQMPLNALEAVPAQYGTASNTADFTATAAQLAGADQVVLNLTGALGAGRNITTPSASALFQQMPNAFVNTGYSLRIMNTSAGAFAWTVLAGAGVTLSGTMTINQNTYTDFIVTFTGAAACTIQRIGTGTP